MILTMILGNCMDNNIDWVNANDETIQNILTLIDMNDSISEKKGTLDRIGICGTNSLGVFTDSRASLKLPWIYLSSIEQSKHEHCEK